MRAKMTAADEQYRLIMECRASGLTDHQWCMEHGIKPGTFYNWVKRLRKAGVRAIPGAARLRKCPRQEVVKVETAPAASRALDRASDIITEAAAQRESAMEVAMNGAVIRIPNGTDQTVLQCVLRTLGEMPC